MTAYLKMMVADVHAADPMVKLVFVESDAADIVGEIVAPPVE